jgi:hypothetical protein
MDATNVWVIAGGAVTTVLTSLVGIGTWWGKREDAREAERRAQLAKAEAERVAADVRTIDVLTKQLDAARAEISALRATACEVTGCKLRRFDPKVG